jgi:hypothetical protein
MKKNKKNMYNFLELHAPNFARKKSRQGRPRQSKAMQMIRKCGQKKEAKVTIFRKEKYMFFLFLITWS